MLDIQEKRSTRTIITHTIVWLVLFLLPYVNYLYQPEKLETISKGFLVLQGLTTIYLMAAFYFNLNVLGPRFLSKNQNRKFVLIIFIGLIIYIGLNYVTFYYFLFNEGQNVHRSPAGRVESRGWLIFSIFIVPTIFYSLNILISTLLYLFYERRRQRELNQLTELEKTAAELSMLKLQISPHFLFNTLNNIRWLVRKKSEQSEEAILKLSEILRYIIYDIGDAKVEVGHEIDHLRNYIELQKLRLPVQGQIDFVVSDEVKTDLIHPLLFIHFVENAFKYGIGANTEPEIYFEVKKSGKELTFHSKNKILNAGTNLTNEGIGLTNIKRRLELLYPNKHELQIKNDSEYFEVILKLTLDEN